MLFRSPAQLMAAATVDIPAIVLSGGPMLDGWMDGELVGSGAAIWKGRRQLAAGAPAHLLPGGWLLIEHGWQQADAVQAILRQTGFAEVASWQDLAGHQRVSGGRWPSATA